MRRFLPALLGLLVCCTTAIGGAGAATATPEVDRAARLAARTAAVTWLGGQIAAYQRATWRWQRVMGTPATPTEGRLLAEMSVPDVRRAVVLWKGRADAARRQATRPPHLRAFLCIHRFEGSWTEASGPYYGGLQMDLSFQRTYAPHLVRQKGTADNWTPLEQIWTAEKALRSRGFWPWPNTARFCGLL